MWNYPTIGFLFFLYIYHSINLSITTTTKKVLTYGKKVSGSRKKLFFSSSLLLLLTISPLPHITL
ncbi:uncharacterized protein EV154DRAFT_509254 [Mucor mucedo]|uniref:uncharacterized protein n=1 Tax=Mucor mucedo TaxID=29922 RepID=UPI00221F9277|nr:uncharacterized protein EV154DRAFT_509254 [Mucor mucedo]KAI7891129.1 hypothetical protein EV154DRAFT_509254 [Mucor mucedo]